MDGVCGPLCLLPMLSALRVPEQTPSSWRDARHSSRLCGTGHAEAMTMPVWVGGWCALQSCNTKDQNITVLKYIIAPHAQRGYDALDLSKHPVRFAFCMNTLHARWCVRSREGARHERGSAGDCWYRALAIDCTDPPGLAHWWSPRARRHGRGASPKAMPHCTPRRGLALDFLPVPEPKTGKNRLHLDVRSGDFATAVEQALALGATRAKRHLRRRVLAGAARS